MSVGRFLLLLVPGIGATLLACLHDFSAFEGGTTATDAAAVPDATTTIPNEASVPTGDGAGGPCTSAPVACLNPRDRCRDDCKSAAQACIEGCSFLDAGPDASDAGDAGDAGDGGNPIENCSTACVNALNKCNGDCDFTCITCSGSCTTGCLPPP